MRTFLWTLVVAMSLIATAFFLGWLSVSADRADGRLTASLHINSARARDAAETVEERARQFGAKARDHIDDLVGTESAMGNVYAVDEERQEFTLSASDERVLTIRIDPTTRVTASRIRGLQIGDRVTVVFTTKDGEHVARSLTIE